jgi:choline kinase
LTYFFWQIIVVDFEYASPNPAAFDIANHFLEWTSNYGSSTMPHVLDPKLYPTLEERRNFYQAYLKQISIMQRGSSMIEAAAPDDHEEITERLDRQVSLWSPASHAMWAVWALVQAREMVESPDGAVEFDYVSYANGRMQLFRQQIQELGIITTI